MTTTCAGLLGDAGDLVREGPPAELGLDTQHQHDVAPGSGRGIRLVGWPGDAPGAPVVQAHLGSGGLEVVVLLGVDQAKGSARHCSIRWRTAIVAASPASFQPAKAAINVGSVNAGRRLQTTCSIGRDATRYLSWSALGVGA